MLHVKKILINFIKFKQPTKKFAGFEKSSTSIDLISCNEVGAEWRYNYNQIIMEVCWQKNSYCMKDESRSIRQMTGILRSVYELF